MANIVDSLSQSSMSTVASFFRNLFFFLGLSAQEYNRTAALNTQLATHKKFLDKLNEYYDFDKQQVKTPDKPCPFDISTCKTFATPELRQAFENAGIDYIMFNNADKTYLVTESDAATRAQVNAIKFDVCKQNCISPRFTKEELFADNANKDILSFHGFSSSQVESFENYAKQNGFFFAASPNEQGTYTIHVAKSTAEMPAFNIQGKLNEIAAFESSGLNAEVKSINAKHRAAIIEQALNEQRRLNPSISMEKVYIVDSKNPGHYMTLNGNTLTIVKDGQTQRFMDGEHEQRIFNEISGMEFAVKASESEFRNTYAQDVLNPAARMKFAKDNFKVSNAEIDAHVIKRAEEIAKAQGFNVDITKQIIEQMIRKSADSKSLDMIELNKMLKTTPPSREKIMSMLETGDALKSGCTTDIITAKAFNDVFAESAHTIATAYRTVEQNVQNCMQTMYENGELVNGKLSDTQRSALLTAVASTREGTNEIAYAVASNYAKNTELSFEKSVTYEIVRADSIEAEMDKVIAEAGWTEIGDMDNIDKDDMNPDVGDSVL